MVALDQLDQAVEAQAEKLGEMKPLQSSWLKTNSTVDFRFGWFYYVLLFFGGRNDIKLVQMFEDLKVCQRLNNMVVLTGKKRGLNDARRSLFQRFLTVERTSWTHWRRVFS